MPSLFYPELRIVRPFVNVQPYLADFEPDLVHLVNPVFLGLGGLRAAHRLGIPVVASYQTDIPGFMRLWGFGSLGRVAQTYLRWLHNQVDLTLVPSHFTRSQIEAQGFLRVKVWERGVDVQRFHPSRYSQRWRLRLSGGHPEAPLLLYVGRLSSEKRVDWLPSILQALPHVRLAIVGDGPARPGLEEMFTGLPAVFTGYLRGQDLYDAYASADLFVFPSTNETVGNVVLEAMASGLPVIAPRSGGLLDHVVNNENGLLFEPEDVQAMVAKVRALVQDPRHARRLGEAGRRYVEVRDWPLTLDALLEDYASVIGPRSFQDRGKPPRATKRPATAETVRP
jgi:glycosyltransferase involved in cell wall biosynthesis